MASFILSCAAPQLALRALRIALPSLLIAAEPVAWRPAAAERIASLTLPRPTFAVK